MLLMWDLLPSFSLSLSDSKLLQVVMMIMKMTCLETQTDRQTDRRQGKHLMVLGVGGEKKKEREKGRRRRNVRTILGMCLGLFYAVDRYT